ncbi:molybdate transport system substrate-binding protein [Microbacterium resistens]|uniref:Molybdate transport system substrate-binding protein n=1 Tax=Microbacterium resistens TaxID=156977 RepID=A0ABU1SGQ5_9MICO|nr:substrate-binding domain-containing protein [Microbacterium resistens]MDR6868148.1 molybdate transport system substrate-binding protein [Microbacterium resistens]
MITLYSGLVVRQALEETVIPLFEQATGERVEATFEPTTMLLGRIADGERPDLMLGLSSSVRDLADQGVLAHEGLTDIAISAVGFARLPETAAPIDGTAETFLDYLRAAPAVAYTLSGASGLHFMEVLRAHDLLDEIDERAVRFPAGLTAESVVDGRATVAIQQVSELRAVPGPHLVAPIPHALQSYMSFAIGVRPGAPQTAAAFASSLGADDARRAFAAVGLSAP